MCICVFFFFQTKDGIQYFCLSLGLGDVYYIQTFGFFDFSKIDFFFCLFVFCFCCLYVVFLFDVCVICSWVDGGVVADHSIGRKHDFRRGHAQDMVESGCTLGEWRSPAFMAYVDYAKLEAAAVVAAHAGDSSDSD